MLNLFALRKNWLVLLTLFGSSGSVLADDLTDRFTFNGFGYQDFRQTSANRVDYVGSGGSWDHNFLGLIMAAQMTDKSKIWAQLQADSTEQTRFTWLFADYQFTSTLTGHAGRVKFPFGLINEYIDNKALQLSLNLPMAYAESADMTYDSYNGVGLDWNGDAGGWGSYLVQGYAGGIYNAAPPNTIATQYPNNPPVSFGPPVGTQEQPVTDHWLTGGRVTWNSPLQGLRFMLSGSVNQVRYAPLVASPYAGQMANEYRQMYSVEYRKDAVWIQSEYNLHRFPGGGGYAGINSDSYYLQGGYLIGNFLPFLRYQSLVTNQNDAGNPNFYQRQWAMGTNYALNKNVNLRFEADRNHGYALPIASQGTPYYTPGVALFPGALLPALDWNEFGIEVNFMF